MKPLSKILSIPILLFVANSSLFATPQFAREHNLDCSSCHTNLPMLNDMGKTFLRNGFRFSKEDRTSLSKALNKKDDNSTYIPIGLMLGIGYNSATEDLKPKIKLFSAGSLTSNLSYFLSINKENPKGYFQYNINESEQVFRVGILSPFTQLGNINKLSTNSGLKGNNGSDGKNQNQKNNRANGNGNGKNSNGNGGGNQPYKTPIQNSYFRDYKGIEYSYLYDYSTLFLISFGKTLDNSTKKKKDTSSNNNAQNDQDPDSADKEQLITAIRYQTTNGYYIGLMYDKIYDSEKTNYSIIAFLEKDFDKFLLNISYIYKNNKDDIKNYYGIENTLSYKIDETSNIKFIVNIDEDEESFENRGYSIGYSKLYKDILFNIAQAKRKTITKDEDIFQVSINMFF